jgi:phage shock protein PspC (stress-responsive transcriptional regulator)
MKRFYRSRTNKKLGGICAGIGDYFSIDPTIVRILVFTIGLCTAVVPLLLIYFVVWIIAPEAPKKHKTSRCKKLYRSRKYRVLSGFCGGVAEFFKLDPTVVRILFIVILFVTAVAPMIIVYIFASVITPERPNKYDPIEIEVE